MATTHAALTSAPGAPRSRSLGRAADDDGRSSGRGGGPNPPSEAIAREYRRRPEAEGEKDTTEPHRQPQGLDATPPGPRWVRRRPLSGRALGPVAPPSPGHRWREDSPVPDSADSGSVHDDTGRRPSASVMHEPTTQGGAGTNGARPPARLARASPRSGTGPHRTTADPPQGRAGGGGGCSAFSAVDGGPAHADRPGSCRAARNHTRDPDYDGKVDMRERRVRPYTVPWWYKSHSIPHHTIT